MFLAKNLGYPRKLKQREGNIQLPLRLLYPYDSQLVRRVIRPKRDHPPAKKFFLDFPAGGIAEESFARLKRIVGEAPEHFYEIFALPA
jgi:hypothetical protein